MATYIVGFPLEVRHLLLSFWKAEGEKASKASQILLVFIYLTTDFLLECLLSAIEDNQ